MAEPSWGRGPLHPDARLTGGSLGKYSGIGRLGCSFGRAYKCKVLYEEAPPRSVGRERGHRGFPMLWNEAAMALGEQYAANSALGALSPEVLLKVGQG